MLILACFISSRSRIIVCRSTCFPVLGCCSCRFTPFNFTGFPFMVKISPRTSIFLTPNLHWAISRISFFAFFSVKTITYKSGLSADHKRGLISSAFRSKLCDELARIEISFSESWISSGFPLLEKPEMRASTFSPFE